MDKELKDMLEALKADIGKQTDIAARVDQLETRIAAGDETVKTARAEIDTLKQTLGERDKAIAELREAGKVQAMRADPLTRREEGLRMLGMIVRQELARANHMELPSAFRHETELVRTWHNDVLARATVTPMATTGSYMVPTVTDGSIQSAIEDVSQFLGMCDMQTGLPAGGTFNFTYLSTRPTMQKKRASTDTAMTASDPVFAQLQLTPQETYVFYPIDNKLFLMSAVSLGGYFEGLTRDAMIDKLAYWALNADASADYNSVRGALHENTADYIYTMPNGKTAFSDLVAGDLTKAKAKLLARGRGPRARWVMSLDVQGVIEDIDRTGKLPVIREREDGTYVIKQNPVVIDEYMPTLDDSAAATGFALLGDLSTILVGMVGGLQIASDSSVKFDKNQTAFRGTTIVDIKRKPVKTLVVLKTAAQ